MYCSVCSYSSPPQARFCIFCGAPIAATGPTERLAQGSVDPYWGTAYPSPPPIRMSSAGSMVYRVGSLSSYGSVYWSGTQQAPSNMLYFGGQWYKVVPE